MKAYLQQYRTVIRRGILILTAVWCLWYARPVDIYDLMGCEEPAYLSVTVWRQADLDHQREGLPPGRWNSGEEEAYPLRLL